MDLSHQPDTVCGSCAARFPGSFGPGQADGCAGEARPEGITCAYGSDFDDREFDWTGRPDWVADGPICDTCIARLRRTGALRERDLPDPRERDPAYFAAGTGPADDARVQPCAVCGAAPAEASSNELHVEGGYGSRYDRIRLTWRQAEAPPVGALCDGCIDRARRQGRLIDPTEL
jgi:hypothetical protein